MASPTINVAANSFLILYFIAISLKYSAYRLSSTRSRSHNRPWHRRFGATARPTRDRKPTIRTIRLAIRLYDLQTRPEHFLREERLGLRRRRSVRAAPAAQVQTLELQARRVIRHEQFELIQDDALTNCIDDARRAYAADRRDFRTPTDRLELRAVGRRRTLRSNLHRIRAESQRRSKRRRPSNSASAKAQLRCQESEGSLSFELTTSKNSSRGLRGFSTSPRVVMCVRRFVPQLGLFSSWMMT